MPRTLRSVAAALAWVILVPLAALVPNTQSASASETDSTVDIAADIAAQTSFSFGERVSSAGSGASLTMSESTSDPALFTGPPSPLSNAALANAAFASAALAGGGHSSFSGGMSSGFAGLNAFNLPDPDFKIWPARDELQIVQLETFLYVDKEWDDHFDWIYLYYYWHTADFEPIGSKWHFKERDTGKTSTVRCIGRGIRWIYGLTNSPCGKDWHHSSDVTGDVEIKMQIVYWLDFNSSHGSYSGPYLGPKSDAADLTVAEVQAYGKTIAAPVNGNPDRGDGGGNGGSGVCSVWGITIICKVGKRV